MKTLEEIRENKKLIIVNLTSDGGMGYIDDMTMKASVIWSFGSGWDHVSVAPLNHRRIPTWDDMCRVKDMFFREDEWVIQFHPPKDEYINNMPNCLHLWKPQKETMPTPPAIMVGIKKEWTPEDVRREIENLPD